MDGEFEWRGRQVGYAHTKKISGVFRSVYSLVGESYSNLRGYNLTIYHLRNDILIYLPDKRNHGICNSTVIAV